MRLAFLRWGRIGGWWGLLVCAAVAASLGCEQADDAPPRRESFPPSGFVQYDSAGIEISATAGWAAETPLGWVLEETPDLVIGGEDQAGRQFYSIRGVVQLPDGGIVLLDGSSRELRFFDGNGQLRHRFGRKGKGPGEFQAPYLVPTPGSDSLLVFDGALRRFHWISNDGEGYRLVTPEQRWPTARPPLGARGSLLFTHSRISSRPRAVGLDPDTLRFTWVDLLTGRTEATATSVVIGRSFVTFISREGVPHSMAIPFVSLDPPVVVLPTGGLVGDPRGELREYDTKGVLRRIVRVEGMGRPVTPETLEAFIDFRVERSSRSRAGLREDYSKMPVPDTLPMFASLHLDEEGWVWAESYEFDPGRSRTATVFDRTGRARGAIRLPAGLTIHEIGTDFVLGVWKDEWGVEFVRRYRLRRNPADSDPAG